ncbi:MAG: O-antigen ligase family protein, partial [Bacteroidota bacterium]|nr:O-antigen ligase family protein [Bacteroidota bacterium]
YSNYDLLSQSIGFGGSLPTPINHIRYSVLIAASLILCLAFCIEGWKVKYAWERWAYGAAAIYLFYFLHVLSVRSGIVLGYAGILILSLFYLQKLKTWMQVGLIASVILAPIIAYKTLPGFQLKVNYTLYDLGQFKAGTGDQYSDSERWASWQAGLALGNQHPFFGLGTGSFVSEMKAYYQNELKLDKWNRPHNQWINVFAIFGLVGLVVFCFVLIFPMTFALFWKPALFPTLYIIQLLSMIVEHPLDTEFGTMLFLVLTCLGLSTESENREKRENVVT